MGVYSRLYLLLSLLTITLSILPQSTGNHTWPDSLNTAKNDVSMSDLEKSVVLEMNKVRSNPRDYAQLLKQERELYEGLILKKDGQLMQTKEGIAAVDECIRYLENTNPVRLLYPDKNLNAAAGYMAADKADTGLLGHSTSDGLTMKQRLEKYVGDNYQSLGENISYGFNDAYSIVIQLLIDDGVPSRGHRNNLMDGSFSHCGVSFDTHPVYKYLCIIDYAHLLPYPLH